VQAVQDDAAGPALRGCCALLGCFAQPEPCLEVLLPRLEDAAAEPRALAAALDVLAGLLQGSALSGALAPHLGPLLQLLLSTGLARSEDLHIRAAVGRVAEQAVVACQQGAAAQHSSAPEVLAADAVQQLLLVLLHLQGGGEGSSSSEGSGGGGGGGGIRSREALVARLAAAQGCHPQQLLDTHRAALLGGLLQQHSSPDSSSGSSRPIPCRELQVMCHLLVPVRAWGQLCSGPRQPHAGGAASAAAAAPEGAGSSGDATAPGPAACSLLELLGRVLPAAPAGGCQPQEEPQVLLALRALSACLAHWPRTAWPEAGLRRLVEEQLAQLLQSPAAGSSAPLASAALACLQTAAGICLSGCSLRAASCAQGLAQCLQHSCAAVRRQACAVLAEGAAVLGAVAQRDERLMQALMARVDDWDAGVRAAALAALAAVAQAGCDEGEGEQDGCTSVSCGAAAAGCRQQLVQELERRAAGCRDDDPAWQQQLLQAMKRLGVPG
jgi:hypothetical protein